MKCQEKDCEICKRLSSEERTNPLHYVVFMILSVSLIIGVLLCLKQ